MVQWPNPEVEQDFTAMASNFDCNVLLRPSVVEEKAADGKTPVVNNLEALLDILESQATRLLRAEAF